MKSKGPQEGRDPARPEAKALSPDTILAPNGAAVSQLQPAPPDASGAFSVAPGKTAAQSADSPQPREGAKTAAQSADLPQRREATKTAKQAAPLIDGSSVSRLPNLSANAAANTTSQTGVKLSPTVPDSAQKSAESTVSHGQTESKILLPSLSERLPGPAAQSQEGTQLRQIPTPAANKTPVGKEGGAAEADTKRLPPESLAKDGTKAVPAEKSLDLVKQNVPNTPTAQDNQALLKEGASDAKSGPKTSATTLAKPDGRTDSGPNSQTLSDSPNGSGREGGLGEKTLTGESLLQRLNATLVQTAASQAKTRDSKASDGSLAQGSEQIIARNSPRVGLAEQPSGASQDARTAGNASYANVSASVSEQIQESLRASLARPDQQITIRLNPPELGTVLIKFQEQNSQITGVLEAARGLH
jgi:flagellar hook-length control protein FliK